MYDTSFIWLSCALQTYIYIPPSVHGCLTEVQCSGQPVFGVPMYSANNRLQVLPLGLERKKNIFLCQIYTKLIGIFHAYLVSASRKIRLVVKVLMLDIIFDRLNIFFY